LKKHLAGIIPVSGIKSDFNMPWHASLMPIGLQVRFQIIDSQLIQLELARTKN